MKILFDMNLSPRWVIYFTESGTEAVHWINIGPANASDTEIMDYARDHSYVIITHDLDFGAILSSSFVIRAIQEFRDDLEKGAIVTIDNTKVRVHILPF